MRLTGYAPDAVLTFRVAAMIASVSRNRARQCRDEVDQLRREIADLKKEKAELIVRVSS